MFYRNSTTSRFTSKVYFPLELIIITWKFDYMKVSYFFSFFVGENLYLLSIQCNCDSWHSLLQRFHPKYHICMAYLPNIANAATYKWMDNFRDGSCDMSRGKTIFRAVSLIIPFSYTSACYARINFVSYFHWNWRNSTNTRISLSLSHNEYFDLHS